MARPPSETTGEAILDAAVALLEAGGYDAVQVRAVAAQAHASLASIYRRYATVDDLVAAALERWLATHAFAPVDLPRGVSLRDGLILLFRHVFGPYEQAPLLLAAYGRLARTPAGSRMRQQGLDLIVPEARALFAGLDPGYAAAVEELLTNVARAATERFAAGELAIGDLLPMLERAVVLATGDNAAAAAGP